MQDLDRCRKAFKMWAEVRAFDITYIEGVGYKDIQTVSAYGVWEGAWNARANMRESGDDMQRLLKPISAIVEEAADAFTVEKDHGTLEERSPLTFADANAALKILADYRFDSSEYIILRDGIKRHTERAGQPFISIHDIVTPGHEGWANVVINPTGWCIGMVRPEVATEIRQAFGVRYNKIEGGSQ